MKCPGMSSRASATPRPSTRDAHASLPPAMRAAVDEFARYLAAERNRSPHTVRAYVGDTVSLLDHAVRQGIAEVGSLTLTALRGWLAQQRSRGAARSTLARRATVARAFTTWASINGLLTRDVGAGLANPRPQRALPQILRADQAATLMTSPPDASGAPASVAAVALRDRLTLELLYGSGIRVSELCGLDVDDVDRARRVIRVLGKANKERTVPFGLPAERALDAWRERGRPILAEPGAGHALLVGTRGRRLNPTVVRRIVRTYARAAGLPGSSPHGLRHAAATHMRDGGADLRSVQELLGHASLASTQIYTHVTAERLRRAYDQAHPRA